MLSRTSKGAGRAVASPAPASEKFCPPMTLANMRQQGVRSLWVAEAKMNLSTRPARPPGLRLAVSAFFVVPRGRPFRCRAVTPSEVGLVAINPTFPKRVYHRVRVAGISTPGAATAEWRCGLWIHKLGPGGARRQHRRDGKRETGSDCEIAHLFLLFTPNIKNLYSLSRRFLIQINNANQKGKMEQRKNRAEPSATRTREAKTLAVRGRS